MGENIHQPCIWSVVNIQNIYKALIQLNSQTQIIQFKNAGEGVEKQEPSYTICGNANWYKHYGDSLKN